MKIRPPQNQPVPEEIIEAAGRSTLLGRILFNRGYHSVQEVKAILEEDEYVPSDPYILPGMKKLIDTLSKEIFKGGQITVYGDYDVDGVTSTAILVSTLQSAEANVSYHIPNRFTEGYGMNSQVIEELAQQGTSLILTCDCGISNFEEVALAKNLGMTVLVTDHHNIPEDILPADAVVNPKMLVPDNPCRSIPGAGVAYLVSKALQDRLGFNLDYDPLQLVALAVVADVVPLLGENRYFLKKGLKILNSGKVLPGVKALMMVCGLDFVDEETVGFQLAPRLNAPGRVESAEISLNLLMCRDKVTVLQIAECIDTLNTERRNLVEKVLEEIEPEHKPGAIVAFNENWHEGVIGIAAGRLAELNNAPAILLTLKDDKCTVTGSARSIEGIDIFSCLNELKDYLLTYGGHAGAAGLSLSKDKLEQFITAAKNELDEYLKEIEEPQLQADLNLSLDKVNYKVLDEINRLAPFGECFPKPLILSSGILIKNTRSLTGNKHLRLVLEQNETLMPAVWWWKPSGTDLKENQKAKILYTLVDNTYKNKHSLQLDIKEMQIVGEVKPAEKVIAMLDYRYYPGNQPELSLMKSVVYYAEGRKLEDKEQSRYSIGKADTLILLTIPPGLRILQEMITLSGCNRLILNYPIHLEEIKLLQKLMGIIKHLFNIKEPVDLQTLAAATGHLEVSIILALRVLKESGYLSWEGDKDKFIITIKNGKKIKTKTDNYRKLYKVMQETEAFKEFMATRAIGEIRKILM